MKGYLDVLIEDHGSIILFRLLTDAATEWVDENVSKEAPYFGDSLAVERRYAHDLGYGMIGAGLEIQVAENIMDIELLLLDTEFEGGREEDND